MCLPGSTDARLVLSQRRRLAGGSLAGLQRFTRDREEKKSVEGKPVDGVESLRKGEEVRGAGFAGGDVEF